LQATNVERSLVSGPDLGDYQAQTTRFEGFAGAAAVPGTLTGAGQAERIVNGYTTWNLFEVLGVQPLVGRTFRSDDAITIDPKVFANPNPDLPPGKVMLSYGLWQRRFGGDRDVIGRTIQMDGWGSVVVGVLPPTFRIYLPADGDADQRRCLGVLPRTSPTSRGRAWLTVVARLRDGVTLEQAQQEMDAVATRLREVHPFHKTQNLQIRVNGLHRDVVSHARPALLALLGAVGFVLLIACANIANLLLVRATERGREIAVRAAVGSGRGRIIAQMLVESAVLSWAGAVLGVLLAWQGIRLITALGPGNLPRVERAAIDLAALLYTAGAACVAAIVRSPRRCAVAGNLADALRDRGSDTGGMRGNKLRSAFVVLEVALSLVLLIGAGLMVRSFAQIQRVDPGFDARNVVTFNAPVKVLKYITSASRAQFAAELADRLRAIPGVERVGGVTPLLLAGGEQLGQVMAASAARTTPSGQQGRPQAVLSASRPWGSRCRAASSVWTTGGSARRGDHRSKLAKRLRRGGSRRRPARRPLQRRSRSSASPSGSSASSTTCGRPRSPRRGARRCTSRTSSTRSCP
jgi:putative ABC transport system permease protein